MKTLAHSTTQPRERDKTDKEFPIITSQVSLSNEFLGGTLGRETITRQSETENKSLRHFYDSYQRMLVSKFGRLLWLVRSFPSS